MKITNEHKVMGPVYTAQFMYFFETDTAYNPYSPGTQEHVSFEEEMARLTSVEFTKTTPAGQAFSDYVESVNENPYPEMTDEHSQYSEEMARLTRVEL